MRILLVLDYYYPHIGGVEVLFQRLAESLVKKGHSVKVITTRCKGYSQREVIKGVNIDRVNTPVHGDRYFFTFLSFFLIFRNIKNYDLVHTSAYSGALAAFLAARLNKRPIIFTSPEVLDRKWKLVNQSRFKAFLYSWYENFITKLPYDYFIAISNSTLNDARNIGVNKSRSIRIYCGVDKEELQDNLYQGTLRKRIGAADEEFLYVYFGRPGITKGLFYLLHASRSIQQQVPDSRLVLILAKEPIHQFTAILREVEKLSRDVKIHLLPSIENKAQLHANIMDANCIVIPSLTEGFGLAAGEACQLGIPVVATRVGSLPEVVSGRHILIEPASSSAIALAVIRVARGDWDETPLKSFSWETMVDSYTMIYRQLIPSVANESTLQKLGRRE